MLQAAVMDAGWLEPPEVQEFFRARVSRRCREKLERIRPADARARSLAAELLLRGMLRRLELPFPGELAEEPGGKPYFPQNPALRFNLSHSGDLAAGVVSGREAGVDVQQIRPLKAPVAERYFSREEREWIRAGKDPDKRVIQIWALRESYMKKTGEGLGLPLEDFSMLPPGGGEPSPSAGAVSGFRVARQGREQPERFWLYEPVPGYALAVCGQEEESAPVWQIGRQEIEEFFGWNGNR